MRKASLALAGAWILAAALAPAPAPVEATCVAEQVARCGKCGDGFCNPSCGENQFTCPRDCAVTAD